MTEINKVVISEILQKNYGIIPENLVLVRRKVDRQLWKITDTTKNVYALKYLQKYKRAPFIAAVNDYMCEKGIPVTTVLSTLDGTSFVNVDDGCFLLFQWLEGEQPNYSEPEMIEKMATLLAKFHVASQGYVAAGNPITDSRLDWNGIYQRKIRKMEKCQKKATVSRDSFSNVFLYHLPWLQSRVNWVLDQLPHTALRALLDAAQHEPHLAHGDYSPLNLIWSNNNELTVIDMDTVSIALPMRDISHLITWVNHALGSWSRERFQLVLDAYQQIHPLSSEEHELLLLDQIFPHKAIRLSEKYFKSPENSKLLKEFECCIEIDKKKLNDLGLGPTQ
ncbi:Spore coat protein I [Bacillus rhizoplanae]|uniref:Spore coat protein I n=1 Tax=Bacillus rhizoplanae TaxID=2880966 RepID=A0ABM8YBJ8_9BACI|nr:CotS family spore coat protein [Bacillus rhizoplanae]CAG9613119.1 Spore coat protein I [Bacillus rhizoplanae]